MRILYITAGAAGMYCGSCFRDNALAAELMAQGHDVCLVPIYTPTLTDETNVSQEKVFFGGISVYLEQHLALFRWSPRVIDRLWDSSWALKLASRRSIPVDPSLLGELTVSMLKGEEGHQRKELYKLIDWLREETPYDVINLPNSLLIGLARPLREALDRPVCCTLQGEDLFLEGLHPAHRNEALDLIRANIQFVDSFIAVSDYYAGFMADYLAIPEEKIHMVPLGINLEGYGVGERRRGEQFTIGYFARISPEKGLHVLCDAYRDLRQRADSPRARLEVAGYLAPENREYLRGIERQMKLWGYADEFRYLGAIDRRQKIEFMQSLDVLSVPTIYREPKGMFLLEAMANGVPVVQPRVGAFPEIIERTGGGMIVEPNPESIADGLLTVWRDRSLSEELSRRGLEGVREHYSAAKMAKRAVEVYSAALARQPGPGVRARVV
jgi:glycosyltransferase involved in cell wall biosynthesis